MKRESFSYDEYINIIENLQQKIPIMDYLEVTAHTEKYCIIRHDVEFSIERAYHMANLEAKKLGITTSYFIQLRNNAYNIFSDKNRNLVRGIAALGHKIGLHLYFENNNESQFTKYILKDIKILQACLGVRIDRFSYHRPSKEILKKNIQIPGLTNPYDKKFFTYYDGNRPEHLEVLYLAESNKTLNNRWPYGYPLDVINNNTKKIQMLIHPYQWTVSGYEDYFDLFSSLTKEKRLEMIKTMQNNCLSFSKLLEKIKKL